MSKVTRRIVTASNISNQVNRMYQGRLQTAQERLANETIPRFVRALAQHRNSSPC